MVLLFFSIFLLFPSSTPSTLKERCLHLTSKEAAREEIVKACIGLDVHVDAEEPVKIKSQFSDDVLSDGFSSIEGRLNITKSDNLKNFVINQLHPNLTKPATVLNVDNNRVLTHLDISEGVKLNDPKYTTNIRGNRHLSRNSIKNINTAVGNNKWTHVQEPGECYFGDWFNETATYNLPKSLDSLKGCVYVAGDLILQEVKNGEWPKSLAEVRGCIVINKTELSDVSFLDNVVIPKGTCNSKNIIQSNRYLRKVPKSINEDSTWIVRMERVKEDPCFDPKYRQNSLFGKRCSSVYSSGSNAEHCEWKSVDQHLGTRILEKRKKEQIICKKLKANFTYIEKYPKVDTDVFAYVEIVQGVIEIINTSMTDIRLFPNLHTVLGDDPNRPLIKITGNQFLKKLEFPSLDYLSSKADSKGKLIVIKDNGGYGMPADDYNRLVYRFGEERLDIHIQHFPGPVPMEKVFFTAAFAVVLIGGYVMWSTVISHKQITIRSSTARSFDAREMFAMIGPMLPWGVKVRYWFRQKLRLDKKKEKKTETEPSQ